MGQFIEEFNVPIRFIMSQNCCPCRFNGCGLSLSPEEQNQRFLLMENALSNFSNPCEVDIGLNLLINLFLGVPCLFKQIRVYPCLYRSQYRYHAKMHMQKRNRDQSRRQRFSAGEDTRLGRVWVAHGDTPYPLLPERRMMRNDDTF